MKSLFETPRSKSHLRGRVSLIFLWLLGVPLPVLAIIFLLHGCS